MKCCDNYQVNISMLIMTVNSKIYVHLYIYIYLAFKDDI